MITRVSKEPSAKPSPPWRASPAMRAACEGVLRRLGWPGNGPDAVRTLGLTSCHSGEGVTTLAAYLALTAAAQEAGPVLLVDANVAQPGVARFCGVQPSPGLAECLRAEERLPAAVQPSPAPNLWVLAGGKPHSSPAGIYDSAGLEPLMKELANDYELVVFDMPPASQASCVAHLAETAGPRALGVRGGAGPLGHRPTGAGVARRRRGAGGRRRVEQASQPRASLGLSR